MKKRKKEFFILWYCGAIFSGMQIGYLIDCFLRKNWWLAVWCFIVLGVTFFQLIRIGKIATKEGLWNA